MVRCGSKPVDFSEHDVATDCIFTDKSRTKGFKKSSQEFLTRFENSPFLLGRSKSPTGAKGEWRLRAQRAPFSRISPVCHSASAPLLTHPLPPFLIDLKSASEFLICAANIVMVDPYRLISPKSPR
jgi:hypothetical protein